MRLMRYEYTISHTPGKDLSTADALSRAPVSQPTASDEALHNDADACVQQVMDSLLISGQKLMDIKEAQEADMPAEKVF